MATGQTVSIQNFIFDIQGGLQARTAGGPSGYNLARRVSQSAVLDSADGSGVSVYDAGLYQAEQAITINIVHPTRAQITAAERLMGYADVTVALWHGGYLCAPESLSYRPGRDARLTLSFLPKRVLS